MRKNLEQVDKNIASTSFVIPSNWNTKKLRDLVTNNGDYGSGAAALEFNANLPRYVRITDITDEGCLDPESFASITYERAKGYFLEKGDLLFARSGATVGKTYLYDEADGECAHAGYVIKFSLDSSVCDPKFIAQFTRSSFYWMWVNRTLRQGAQPNINAEEYKTINIPCPPLNEQQKIAEIFDAIDKAIALTDTHITKLKKAKAGLLHDLLTRGIDDHG